VRLGTKSAWMVQHLEAWVNSASTSCPLRNSPLAPVFNNGYASLRSLPSGARARAVTTSTRPGACLTKSEIRSACTSTGAPTVRAASLRKRAFFWMLSTRCIFAPGRSARTHAMTRPGNPPPEPRSTHIRASGANGMSCRESAMWRVHNIGSVEGAIRLIRCCHSRRSPTKRSRRATVSRETGVSVRARARSPARSGRATCGLVAGRADGLAVLPPHMGSKERQCGRRHAIDTAGMA